MSDPILIWLQGPSGSGKTTIGRLLADRLGLPFFDVDEEVEKERGITIPEIFEHHGEAEFRRLEAGMIQLVATGRPASVVALGAGALADAGSRGRILTAGLRIFLDVASGAAMQRLERDPVRPLLVGGSAVDSWQRLHASRIAFYRDADMTVDTTDLTAERAAELLAAKCAVIAEPAWSRTWRLEQDECTVTIHRSTVGLYRQLRQFVHPAGSCVVTDRNVQTIYSDLLDALTVFTERYAVEPGEEGKRFESVEAIGAIMVEQGIGRDGAVVGLGGGVVTDLAGFVASIYMRGIDSILVPTTLLAQVDAAVGGKTAINAAGIRNLFGSYRQPRHILILPSFLRTLPVRELRSGIVEALKIGIIHRPELVALVQSAMAEILRGEVPESIGEIIRLAVETKFSVIEQDIHDSSVRLSLNFGHTFAHALEAVEPGRYTHGEAVAVGMIAASELASAVGAISTSRCREITRLVLPLAPDVDGDHDMPALLSAMRGDKKRIASRLRFIFPGEETGFLVAGVGPGQPEDALLRAFAAITHYRENLR